MFLALALAIVDGPVFPGLLTTPSLYPGNKAPAVQVKRWLKNGPVEIPAKGLAVVDFWATWCGPCRDLIPHLSEFAKKNPDVTVVSLGIWEKDGPKIDEFMKAYGPKIEYPIAYADNHGPLADAWMEQAGQSTIPTTFVIKDGVIQWIGNAGLMDKVVEDVKSGRLTGEQIQADFIKVTESEIAQKLPDRQLDMILNAIDQSQFSRAHRMLNAYLKFSPDLAILPRLKLLLKGREDPDGYLKDLPAYLKARGDDGFEDATTVSMGMVEKGGKVGAAGAEAMGLVCDSALKDRGFYAYQAVLAFQKVGDQKKAKAYAQVGIDNMAGNNSEVAVKARKQLQDALNGKPLAGGL